MTNLELRKLLEKYPDKMIVGYEYNDYDYKHNIYEDKVEKINAVRIGYIEDNLDLSDLIEKGLIDKKHNMIVLR